MTAVLKREFSAYFKSPVGYVFIAVSFLFSGFFFWLFSLSIGSTDISDVFVGMFYVFMVFVPVLTMRLLADENKQKTDQLLLTAPVGLMSLVFGKFKLTHLPLPPFRKGNISYQALCSALSPLSAPL